MATENDTVAKLAQIKQRFRDSVDVATRTYHGELRAAEEAMLNEFVDVVGKDPWVVEVRKILESRLAAESPAPSTPAPPQTTTPPGMVPLPEKWPKKASRIASFRFCPACRTLIQDVDARFCSQCAYPLFETQGA